MYKNNMQLTIYIYIYKQLYFMLYLQTMIKDNMNIIYTLQQAEYNLNLNLDKDSLYIYLHGNNIKTIKENTFPDHIEIIYLGFNKIKRIYSSMFNPNLKELYLESNKFVKLYPNSFPSKLTDLSLTHNKIYRIKNKYIFPDTLENLWLYNNKISKLYINIFPNNLIILDISNNNISKIKPNLFPNSLKQLYLNNNNISTILPFSFPNSLIKLILDNNYITSIQSNYFSTNLNELSLKTNRINELKIDMFPNNLTSLYLSNNKIRNFHSNILPQSIKILFLDFNKITKIYDNSFPPFIQEIYLQYNYISEIPLSILEYPRLIQIIYKSNPIEYIPLPVTRWLNRMNTMINDNNDIYKDRQNIHNSNIQQSFRNSLSNILKDKLSYSLDHCKNELLKSNCSEEVKRELINFCDDQTQHSIYLITFSDLFLYVMNRILSNQNHSLELFNILDQEMKDTICKCFTGRMTRLLNVLNGFYPDIQILIGTNEQISNIIINLKNKFNGIILKQKIIDELMERGYEQSIIDEWISYIE